MVISKRNLYFHRRSESDKVTFIWLSFTDVRAKRNGKVGGHLDCKTMANVCQVTERVTRICKKANNCCLWRQLNPNHCWDVWTMRWNFALEVIWNVLDKKIQTMCFLWTMVSYNNWRSFVSHSRGTVGKKRASAFCEPGSVFDFKKLLHNLKVVRPLLVYFTWWYGWCSGELALGKTLESHWDIVKLVWNSKIKNRQ